METFESNLNLAELKNHSRGFDRAEMRELFTETNGMRCHCRSHMQVWNLDEGAQACVAPKTYQVIQHQEMVEALVEALVGLNLPSVARVKAAKHAVQIDIDFPESGFELSQVGESFTSGIRIINDYSKTMGLIISPRVTRLACSNGMVVTDVVSPKRVRFSEELKLTVEGTVDKLIHDIISSDGHLQEMVSACLKDSVEWSALRLLVKSMFQQKRHVMEIIGRLPNPFETERINRWQLYNAVTNYATFGQRLKPELDAWLQNKANTLLKHSFDELSSLEQGKRKESKDHPAEVEA